MDEPTMRAKTTKAKWNHHKPAFRLITTELVPSVAEAGPVIRGPEEGARYITDLIGRKDREHFVILHLDGAHRPRAIEITAIGTLNSVPVMPREVFKAAILSNAKAIICGHNHPSGDLRPSAEDDNAYRMLRDAGNLLGVPVLDFLIVHGARYYSFQENGRLSAAEG
jgi:DNA repair protein RadC